MTDPTGHRVWRVFYTRARAEMQCARHLAAQEIPAFVPTYREVRQWKDRKKMVEEPLFRNYVFAHVDERERIQTLQTPGIVRCVSFGGTIAEVQPAEIEQLEILQRDPERRRSLAAPCLPAVGRLVEITEPPLRGLRGQVVEHRGQWHLLVQVEALQQVVRVHVPAAWVCQEQLA